jgi:hypothetical protein
MFNPRLISALVAADFSSRYYELCKAHNQFWGTCQCPHPEVMKALEGLGETKKLGGPGRVYSLRVPEQRGGMDFSFIIQSGTTAELCLGFEDLEKPNRSNFAVLAYYANQAAGGAAPHPPYPRPHFHTPSELREVISGGLELSKDVAQKLYA